MYHDLTLSETAHRLELSKSYVSELETGRKKASIDVLERYARVFDMPVSSLMLFAENSRFPNGATSSRKYIAEKALKMLQWIDTIGGQQR